MSNVKVYLRIKPHLSEEEQSPLPMEVQHQGGRKRLYFQYRLQQNDTKIFNFDDIFQEDASQPEVYGEFSNDLMTSVHNGFNYCLMAYGQTSSGKSYTLLGGEVEGSEGILPRFVRDLFDFKESGDYDLFEVKCSFFEIYNEQIFDLLQESENRTHLALREDPKKGVFVENLTHLTVETLEEMMEYFAVGMSHRSTAETRLNERSSRSHGIFTIKVEHMVEDGGMDSPDSKTGGKKASQVVKIKRCSTIHFVDLAGSERQFESDAERMKETCQINKSLVVLSNVITSMTEKNKRYMHFRDSKLTFYLRDVFGGNSRTAVITNVLNESSYYFETWNTLRFAAKAKSIKISPKANFDTEGSEEALKQEISHLLRKIDMLEKNSKGHAQGPAVNNQQVIKLVDRLETAWDGVINGIEERQLLLKEAISKSDEYFINLIMEFRQCLVGRNSEFILKTKFLPILEEMEEFFGQNWTGVGPREVIDKLDCFHEIVKDEIRSLKGVVQSKPQTAKDKLKRIKKRWQHSLERIDEIMSDEEEEKEIINGLLSCMDETSPSAETGKDDQNANKDSLLAEKRFTWGSTDDQANGRVSQPEFHKNPELKDRLMIDLASLNPHNNQEQHLSKDFQEGDMIAGNSKTGRLSSARTKDVKIAEVQELLSQFTPQKIRMVIKENDLLNKKIQKQRFLILEMKKKMDEVEEQRVTKTHRLNRSCDDIPASLLGNLEKVVDESVAPWNDNEFRNFDSIYDERKSFHHRRSTLKGRQSSQTQGFRGQTIDSLLEEDIKINSPRNNEVAESIREILSSDELQEEPKKAQTISKNPEARFPDKRKEEMLNNLFDPAKRFQPKSQKEWRDTGFDRDSYEPYTNVDNLNPMVSTEDFSPYAERASEGVIVESPVKDPFKRSYEPEEINFSSKKREHFESPLSFKKESHMVKSDLESLSKKFKDLEEQKAKWEKKLTLQDAQKENKVNFSKQKIPSENEIIASEKLNGEVVNSSPLIVGSKAPGPPSKISLFTEKQQVSKETKSSKQPTGQIVGSTDESDRHQKHSSNGRIEPHNTRSLKPAQDDPYRSAGAFKKEAYSSPMKLPLRSNYTEETPPRILTDFMPEDSMRRSNNDEELKLMEVVIQEKSKEAIGYLKLIEKLQKENDQLRDNTDANSSLAVYKLKLENKKLKEAIRKIAGKVKQEIDTDPL